MPSVGSNICSAKLAHLSRLAGMHAVLSDALERGFAIWHSAERVHLSRYSCHLAGMRAVLSRCT